MLTWHDIYLTELTASTSVFMYLGVSLFVLLPHLTSTHPLPHDVMWLMCPPLSSSSVLSVSAQDVVLSGGVNLLLYVFF